MKEDEISQATPAVMRVREAEFFLSQYGKSSGPPIDSYFEMICYFDGFLFTLVSLEELVDAEDRATLRAIDIFRFFKVLRNVTTHHAVIAAPLPTSKFARPFGRDISASVGGPQNDSSRLRFNVPVLIGILDDLERERPYDKKILNEARVFAASLRPPGTRSHYLDDLMNECIDAVKAALKLP